MLFAGHLIGRSGDAAGNSNEDGWPETTNASRASNARIGFGGRIVELNLKFSGTPARLSLTRGGTN